MHCNAFPLNNEAVIAFKTLKNDLCNASLGSIQDGVPYDVETDASDFALAAVLSQYSRPVAFMSRALSACEKRYSAVEKEATAIIEEVRKWLHFLKGRHFTIFTDQEAVSLDNTNWRAGRAGGPCFQMKNVNCRRAAQKTRQKGGPTGCTKKRCGGLRKRAVRRAALFCSPV